MAKLIIGVVQNILGHVSIEDLESGRVRRVAARRGRRLAGCRVNRREVRFLDSTEFPVLLPTGNEKANSTNHWLSDKSAGSL